MHMNINLKVLFILYHFQIFYVILSGRADYGFNVQLYTYNIDLNRFSCMILVV
jgi:hypothetical protein